MKDYIEILLHAGAEKSLKTRSGKTDFDLADRKKGPDGRQDIVNMPI